MLDSTLQLKFELLIMQVDPSCSTAQALQKLNKIFKWLTTTNYDNFQETVLFRSSSCNLPSKPIGGVGHLTEQKVFVYHLHGIVMGRGDEAPVATRTDYANGDAKARFEKVSKTQNDREAVCWGSM